LKPWRLHVPLMLAGIAAITIALVIAGWRSDVSLASAGGHMASKSLNRKSEIEFVRPQQGRLPWASSHLEPAFDVRQCAFVSEIYELAPRPGDVPVLESPLFVEARLAAIEAREPVLGLKIDTEARCYPIRIMNYHSLVLDRVAGQAIYVFWDPPSGMALARRQWASWRPLGLAGLGFRGTGLAYEPATGALWDLFGGGPLSAPGKNVIPPLPQDYQWLPLERMTFRAWHRLHPQTLVLSSDTGYGFDYNTDPYTISLSPSGEIEDYWNSDTLLAPESLRTHDEFVRDKAPVLGFLAGKEAWAVPLEELAVSGSQIIIPAAAGAVTIHVEPFEDRYYALDASGRWLPQLRLFWFAWKARFPHTKIWHPQPTEEEED